MRTCAVSVVLPFSDAAAVWEAQAFTWDHWRDDETPPERTANSLKFYSRQAHYAALGLFTWNPDKATVTVLFFFFFHGASRRKCGATPWNLHPGIGMFSEAAFSQVWCSLQGCWALSSWAIWTSVERKTVFTHVAQYQGWTGMLILKSKHSNYTSYADFSLVLASRTWQQTLITKQYPPHCIALQEQLPFEIFHHVSCCFMCQCAGQDVLYFKEFEVVLLWPSENKMQLVWHSICYCNLQLWGRCQNHSQSCSPAVKITDTGTLYWWALNKWKAFEIIAIILVKIQEIKAPIWWSHLTPSPLFSCIRTPHGCYHHFNNGHSAQEGV